MPARRQTLRSAQRPADEASNLRGWTRRPARPIWYWPLPRFLDWWNGRRDGRAGIPWFEPVDEPAPSTMEDRAAAVPEGSGEAEPADLAVPGSNPGANDGGPRVRWPCDRPIIPPPYLRYLRSRAADAARVEWVRAEARIARAQARVDELRAVAASLLRALTDANDHVAGLPVDLDERTLNERTYTDELRQRPASLSRSRRRGDHEKAIEAAKAARRRADESYLAQSAAIARIEALIAAEKRVRTARILRIHEHMRRREASYWRHLVRHHPHGSRLSGCLDPAAPDLPPWVMEADGSGPQPAAPAAETPPAGGPPPDGQQGYRPNGSAAGWMPAVGPRTGNEPPVAPGETAEQGGRG